MEYTLSGQRAKSQNKALMAGSSDFGSSRTALAPSKFGVTTTTKTKLAPWGNYAKITAITLLTNKTKNAEFTIPPCKMLVPIGLVPLEFYLCGQDESDKEHEPPFLDADENETVEEDQDDVNDGDKKLAAISMEDIFDTTGNVTHSITATTDNVTQSIDVTTENVTHSRSRQQAM
jgi:hypothetical protein